MKRPNILNKEGFLTDEDRTHPLTHGGHLFTFKTCLDLTKPVQIIPYGTRTEYTASEYSRDLASFIAWWCYFVKNDLHGFAGFSHVTFELVDFGLIS